MGKKDPRVDAYIANAAEFAKPILTEIRARVHEACPECEETLKWSSPSFLYRGMLCGMAAFKGRIVHPQMWPEDLDYTGKQSPDIAFADVKDVQARARNG